MSRRLLQLVIPVTPERRMFRIHDPAVDPDAPGGPLPPVGALISTNREQLWVGSLQEDINVRLVLEEWDGAPPPCGDAWDEEAKGSVYLRGQLSVSMGLAGTAVHGLRLGGGVGALISTNREQLWVGSLQEDINVRLVLEEWDGAPPPCGDAWDEEAKGSVYLRGQLSISMGQAGTAVHGLRLGGGVGDYSVHVYASNRDVVTRRYTALFDRHRNPLSDEFQQEKRTLEGLERYLVQLWRDSLIPPD